MNYTEVRKVMLEVISEHSTMGAGYFQMRPILVKVLDRLDAGRERDTKVQEMILTSWYDLFRSGHLSWGSDIGNPELPFIHFTERGQETLEHLSRDPANPDGYIGYLNQLISLTPITQSYIVEALETYNSNCFKATAVMVGAAAESTILNVRDVLVNCMNNVRVAIPGDLQNWKIKTVLDAIGTELEAKKSDMPRELREKFTAYWSAFAEQIRRVRNNAGHPESVDPVTPESVHAALLIFPELAKLAAEIIDWAKTFYVCNR